MYIASIYSFIFVKSLCHCTESRGPVSPVSLRVCNLDADASHLSPLLLLFLQPGLASIELRHMEFGGKRSPNDIAS